MSIKCRLHGHDWMDLGIDWDGNTIRRCKRNCPWISVGQPRLSKRDTGALRSVLSCSDTELWVLPRGTERCWIKVDNAMGQVTRLGGLYLAAHRTGSRMAGINQGP